MTQSFTVSSKLQTAVLFLVFNRRNNTREVFEAIRKAKPPRLYVASDGAREDKPGEVECVEEVRRIATAIDWQCELKTLFREVNLGCKLAVSSAIDWFFENEEQGIILEDDCLPSEEFFTYCEFYLNRFKDDNTIYSVSGSRFGTGKEACLGKYSLMWGWATWKNRWKNYSFELEGIDRLCKEKFPALSTRLYWKQVFQETNLGRINTWDYQWIYCVLANDALVVRPNFNMIRNIGFSSDATHTFDESHGNIVNSFEKTEMSLGFNLLHNSDVDKEDERVWLGLSFFRRIKLVMKHFLLKAGIILK